MTHLRLRAVVAATALLLAAPATAASLAPLRIDSGDTAWILTSTALLLMMTIPGLALFYAGMVRKKNILATMMQSFALTCLVTILWSVIGYSEAFTAGHGALAPFIGDLSRFMLNGVQGDGLDPKAGFALAGLVNLTIPESVFMMFQMTFAIITPAVIAGAFAERMKFSALCLFMAVWSLVVYAPIAHWVWSPTGWLFHGVFGLPGIADFAGGTVVETNSGIAGLVCCVMMGKRLGYGSESMAPFNLSFAMIGASLLWVGWLGFNAGSGLASDNRAGMAVAVTQIAGAAAGLTWMAAEWLRHGKPTGLGIISGAVAGLVAITPAAGFVLPGPAMVIGVVAGLVCFLAVTRVKIALGYDDSLDTFGVHGVGGIIGTLLTGVFAYGPFTHGANVGGWRQLATQALAVGVTILWSGGWSAVMLKLIDAVVGLRVSTEQERLGLDEALHGESLG